MGCFVYYAAIGGDDLIEVAGRTIGHLFFVDNFFSAFAGEYNPLTFTQHLWTIAFEEQVYLFIPLLFAALVGLRRHPGLFAPAVGAVLVLQPVLRWGLTRFRADELTLWVVPFVHFDTIVAGLLLGVGVGSRLRERVPGDVLALAGALVLGGLLVVLPAAGFAGLWAERGVYFFTVLALAFYLVVLGCIGRGSAFAWLLARQPFVFLGRISYGLYVWHLVGNHAGSDLARRWLGPLLESGSEPVRWLAVVLPSLAVTMVLATMSYYALERPFLRMKRRFTVVPNRAD